MKTLLLVAVLLVSAQSAVAQNRGAMARADTNGDQAISLEEFQTARTAQFSRADSNGDGQLSAAELSGMQAQRSQRAASAAQGGGFEAADANGDGNISRDELAVANRTMFSRLDRNRDGRLDTADRGQN